MLAARRLAVAVVVVVAGFVAVDLAFAGSHGAPIGAYTTRGAYSFVTAPSLHPPKLRSDGRTLAGKLAPGYIFTANFYDLNYPPMVGQSGPLILDSNLQPVWFQPVPENVVASNLSLQTYEGKPALAWWQGVVTNTGATESGEDVVVNQHYQTVARLRARTAGCSPSTSFVIDGEDAWVTANKNIAMNLSSYGGAYNGALIDSAVQEYNLKTGKLLRTWDALDHIPLGDSYATRADQRVPVGRLPRQLDRPDRQRNLPRLDAQHVGRLPGRHRHRQDRVDARRQALELHVRPGRGLPVAARRDAAARLRRSRMFDDHCCQLTGGGTSVPATGPSRGLVLKLDQQTRTATLVAQYSGGGKFESEYMGDTQPLPNGNVFVGWGSEPYFSEYSPSGKLLLEGSFPGPDLSYRATLQQWVGLPLSPPAGAARQADGRTTVYASWNGATQVVSWRVLAGPSVAGPGASRLTVVATTAKSGFETAIPLPASYESFEVQALTANDRVLGASRPFTSRAVQ